MSGSDIEPLGTFIPPGLTSAGLAGEGSEAVASFVTATESIGTSWGLRVAADHADQAWANKEQAWIALTESLPTGGDRRTWLLRTGHSSAGLPLWVSALQRLAGQQGASSYVVLPVALGWASIGHLRYWWTLSPAGDRMTIAGAMRGRRTTPALAARWGLHLIAAIDWLHGEGLAHLDIKPENCVLVGGQPRLADFGTLAGLDNHLDVLGTGLGKRRLKDSRSLVDIVWRYSDNISSDEGAEPLALTELGDVIVGTDGFAAPWMRCRWPQSRWMTKNGYRGADYMKVWHDLNLGQRADLYSVLCLVGVILSNSEVRRESERRLQECLAVWLSGDPTDLPFQNLA